MAVTVVFWQDRSAYLCRVAPSISSWHGSPPDTGSKAPTFARARFTAHTGHIHNRR